MLGLNLLVRLGRQVLAGPVAESGLLPASYYRHLTLSAMEAEDFPGALSYLRWAADPLLAQLLVLRLRLLAARHAKQRQAIRELLEANSGTGCQLVSDTGQRPALPEKYLELMRVEERALKLLKEYEALALAMLNRGVKAVKVPL
jgi:hypothetical protein